MSEAAIQFLTEWAPTGPWLLMAADPDRAGRVVVETFHDQTTMGSFLAQYAACNLYWFPNTAEPGVTTTPEKSQITAVNVIHVDVDLKAGLANDEANLTALLHRIEQLEPPPTLTTCSGGGYQLLWRYAQPLTADYISIAEARNKSVEVVLNADHCHNVNRWLQLPGTTNYPSKTKRERGRMVADAYIVSFYPDRTWSHTHDPMPRYADGYAPEADEPTADAPDQLLTSLPARLRRIILSGDASEFRDDRSALVFWVVMQLLRRGWSDDKIVPYLHDAQYGVSAHCRSKPDPEREARRQVERCRSKLEEDWHRNKNGEILVNDDHNLTKALAQLNVRFEHDVFAQRIYVRGYRDRETPTLVDDNVTISLRFQLGKTFGFVPARDFFVDYVVAAAQGNEVHPVKAYLDDLVWDGLPRLDDWLHTYGGAPDDVYTRSVARLFLVAAVRRIRLPGCKFDEMLVLVDTDQGGNKSSALNALAVRDEWFTDSLTAGAKDKEVIEQIQGKWIIECSELTGLKHRDVEELKQFLARRYDRARLAYGRFTYEAARQCVFFGTTNEPVFLKDEQNRRFWPVVITGFDLDALTRDRDQLWAEAAAAEAGGEAIRLDPALYATAATQQETHRQEDPWVETFGAPFGELTGKVSSAALWIALGKPIHLRTQSDTQRVASCMRQLGWEATLRSYEGRVQRVYCRGTAAERMRPIYLIRDVVTNELTASYEPSSFGY